MASMRAVVDLPGRMSALSAARSTVHAILSAWGAADRSEDAQLLASELLANAIEHAPGNETYEMELSYSSNRIRITLVDGSSIRPVVAQLDNDRPRGRGMRLVEALAVSWGSDEDARGKRVWVEL